MKKKKLMNYCKTHKLRHNRDVCLFCELDQNKGDAVLLSSDELNDLFVEYSEPERPDKGHE